MTNLFSNSSSLFCYTREKSNLIQINLDADSSTNSTNQVGGEGAGVKTKKNSASSPSESNQNIIKITCDNYRRSNTKNTTLSHCLNKKTKRPVKGWKNSINNNKDNKFKSAKHKLIFKIFNEFKLSSPSFNKEFPQFNCVEKNVKNNLYLSVNDFANEVRNIFSEIFYYFNDTYQYDKTLILCEKFEKIYKDYDNKVFIKEAKNLTESINKLKKELRQTENFKATYNSNYNNRNNSMSNINKNKFKLSLSYTSSNEDNDEMISEVSMKKFKNEIGNKIKQLNKEQKKGILSVISSNCLDSGSDQNCMKLDINKMPFNQLKELEKYVNNCIKDNNKIININNFINKNINSLAIENSNINNCKNPFFDGEKEIKDIGILGNDNLSSCLSEEDDEDEDDDE